MTKPIIDRITTFFPRQFAKTLLAIPKPYKNQTASVPMSFELADGTIYRGTGQVNFESYESETGKSTCTLIPEGEWTPFVA